MTNIIDPEELPFTTDEIYRAACTFFPVDVARRMADHLTECGPDLIARRSDRRGGWRRAGIANADTLPLYGWVYPEELLPALARLSPDTATRVEALRRTLGGADRDPTG